MIIALSGFDNEEHNILIRTTHETLRRITNKSCGGGNNNPPTIIPIIHQSKYHDPFEINVKIVETKIESYEDDFTHLVIPDDDRRSVRILTALARGNVITKASWLWDSLEHGYWVDTHSEPHLSHRYAASPEHTSHSPLANNLFSVLSTDSIPLLDAPSLAKLIIIAGGTVYEGLPIRGTEKNPVDLGTFPHWIVFPDRDDLINWITIKMKRYDDRQIIRELFDMMSEGVRVVLAKYVFDCIEYGTTASSLIDETQMITKADIHIIIYSIEDKMRQLGRDVSLAQDEEEDIDDDDDVCVVARTYSSGRHSARVRLPQSSISHPSAVTLPSPVMIDLTTADKDPAQSFYSTPNRRPRGRPRKDRSASHDAKEQSTGLKYRSSNQLRIPSVEPSSEPHSKKRRGRPTLPRDENGNIIRTKHIGVKDFASIIVDNILCDATPEYPVEERNALSYDDGQDRKRPRGRPKLPRDENGHIIRRLTQLNESATASCERKEPSSEAHSKRQKGRPTLPRDEHGNIIRKRGSETTSYSSVVGKNVEDAVLDKTLQKGEGSCSSYEASKNTSANVFIIDNIRIDEYSDKHYRDVDSEDPRIDDQVYPKHTDKGDRLTVQCIEVDQHSLDSHSKSRRGRPTLPRDENGNIIRAKHIEVKDFASIIVDNILCDATPEYPIEERNALSYDDDQDRKRPRGRPKLPRDANGHIIRNRIRTTKYPTNYEVDASQLDVDDVSGGDEEINNTLNLGVDHRSSDPQSTRRRGRPKLPRDSNGHIIRRDIIDHDQRDKMLEQKLLVKGVNHIVTQLTQPGTESCEREEPSSESYSKRRRGRPTLPRDEHGNIIRSPHIRLTNYSPGTIGDDDDAVPDEGLLDVNPVVDTVIIGEANSFRYEESNNVAEISRGDEEIGSKEPIDDASSDSDCKIEHLSTAHYNTNTPNSCDVM